LSKIHSKPRCQKIISNDKRNQIGVPGISELCKSGKGDKQLGFFSVTWRPVKGKQKYTSFSISKHGKEVIFKRTVALHYEKRCEVYDMEIATRIVGKI
jgi:hypothetical protein